MYLLSEALFIHRFTAFILDHFCKSPVMAWKDYIIKRSQAYAVALVMQVVGR